MSEIKKLNSDEIQNKLKNLSGWAYDSENDEIYKMYEFKGYYKTIAFVNSVAWYAQKLCHHPDLYVKFGKCEVRLTTHDADGISEKDFELATILDNL